MPEPFVAFIPARGGSKSVPLKNIRFFCGRPLLYWALKAAQDCPSIGRAYVATDSQQIKETVMGFRFSKVEVVARSAETATDEASTESALLEFAAGHEFENLVLVQATSPLLEAGDLEGGIRQFQKQQADSLLSVVRQKRFTWKAERGWGQPVNYQPAQRPRRQDWDGYWVENGAFYITRRRRLLDSRCRLSGKISCYVMPEDTYGELDEPGDWEILEQLKRRRLRRHAFGSVDFRQLNLLICDVDGVLTDARLYYIDGQECRKFSVRDGMGLTRLRRQGIQVMFLTAEQTPGIEQRARKLGIEFLCMGEKDKKAFLESFYSSHPEFSPVRTAYIGDDVNDLAALRMAGFSAAPQDAEAEVKAAASYVCEAPGGRGCVREVCDLILAQRNHAD
jgi:N-acylneuraminate cytidylyltransferase